MSINGKRDNVTREDLLAVGRSISLKKPAEIIDAVVDAVAQWPKLAKQAGVSDVYLKDRQHYHRLLRA